REPGGTLAGRVRAVARGAGADPRRPLAEGPPSGAATDPRRRAAPVQGVGRRGGGPALLAAGRARLRRGGVEPHRGRGGHRRGGALRVVVPGDRGARHDPHLVRVATEPSPGVYRSAGTRDAIAVSAWANRGSGNGSTVLPAERKITSRPTCTAVRSR